MSWIEKVSNDFIITTADGKSYKVDWKIESATTLTEYFIAEFNFVNLAGSKVDRGQPKGNRYEFEFFFQGEENIETSQAFKKSADVLGPWNVSHPLYGVILVQPVSLLYDNTSMNVTRIAGMWIETIAQDNPITTVNPIDNILLDKANLDELFVNSLTNTPGNVDVNNMSANNNFLYANSIPIITLPEDLQNYFNIFKVAGSAINNAIASPIIAMQATQAVISAPGNFATSAQSRLSLLSNQYSTLKNQIVPKNSYQSISPATKQIFAIQGGALISAQLVAAATPQPNNYSNAIQVYNVIGILLSNYNQFLYDLDSIQTSTNGTPTSYVPDAASFIALNSLMSNVISSLFQIALTGRRERILILEKDSNLILLTHRLYGLDEFDNNMEELFVNNNWGLIHLLGIKKDTKVIYYL